MMWGAYPLFGQSLELVCARTPQCLVRTFIIHPMRQNQNFVPASLRADSVRGDACDDRDLVAL